MTTSSATVLVPTKKTNGFAIANPQQQIDRVTGQPVPAPRRSNSIPLGDGMGEPIESATSLQTTAQIQNGSMPSTAAAAGSGTASAESSETQVSFLHAHAQSRYVD